MTLAGLLLLGSVALATAATGVVRLNADSFLLGSLPSHAGQPNVVMPAVGLGTGGGGYNGQSYGQVSSPSGPQTPLVACDARAR